MSDVTFDMQKNEMEIHRRKSEPWRVTLVDTGDHTLTGGRLKRVDEYLKNEEDFCFTYGDGVSDVNISELIRYHQSHGKLATLTAVRPPGRYGALRMDSKNMVTEFQEKTEGEKSWIIGGFFVLKPRTIDFITCDQISWEGQILDFLAKEKQLASFKHNGFWQPMDTLRDKNLLNSLWQEGKAPWKSW